MTPGGVAGKAALVGVLGDIDVDGSVVVWSSIQARMVSVHGSAPGVVDGAGALMGRRPSGKSRLSSRTLSRQLGTDPTRITASCYWIVGRLFSTCRMTRRLRWFGRPFPQEIPVIVGVAQLGYDDALDRPELLPTANSIASALASVPPDRVTLAVEVMATHPERMDASIGGPYLGRSESIGPRRSASNSRAIL